MILIHLKLYHIVLNSKGLLYSRKKLMSLDPDCDALSKEVQDAKFYQLSKLVKTYNETCGKE